MLTLQQIRDVVFEKKMSGYKMSEVDDFIDACAETVRELMVERDELNRKLELLAEKLLEYKNQEDSIHTTLLGAQRSAEAIVREANHKAELILRDARIKAENIEETAAAAITAQQEELRRLEQEVSNFRKRLMTIYRQHIELISELPAVEEPVAEEAPVEDVSSGAPTAEEPARQPVFEEVSVEEALADTEIPAEEAPAEEAPAEAAPEAPAEEAPAAEGTARRRRARFSDLKFGEDYDISSDEE